MTDKAEHGHDAPAHADLPDVASREGPDRPRPLPRARRPKRGYTATRWKNATQTLLFYHFCQRFPNVSRKLLMGGIRRQVEGSIGRRRTRTSIRRTTRGTSASASCPSGDLFRSLRTGTSEIVTDHIETFTEDGITLEVRQAAAGRHRDHRDRPGPASAAAASRCRSTASSEMLQTRSSTAAACSPTSRTSSSPSATRTRRGR